MRPVTALFADVVGSTALGERLSPAEIKILIGDCISLMTGVVEEYGGWLGSFMGDGIAGFFGTPSSHEDDPQRAACAALRILELVAEYSDEIRRAWGVREFSVRLGINSGLAAVGTVGAGEPRRIALGDAINVAARLQSAAMPGSALVGAETAERLSSAFELEPAGRFVLKGKSSPVEGWLLKGRAKPAPIVDPVLIGREAERSRVHATLADLSRGRGQIVHMIGDAGIGKTRLLAETRRIAGDGVLWLEGRCSDLGRQRMYEPFVQAMDQWLGLVNGQPEIAVRARLAARLQSLFGRGEGVDELLTSLGRLHGLRPMTSGSSASPERLSTESVQEMLATYSCWIRKLCEASPVVLAIEDLHDCDDSTAELFQEILKLTEELPLLVVSTMRSDSKTLGWALRLRTLAEHSLRSVEFLLGPLRDCESAALIAVLSSAPLDNGLVEHLVARSEGNPLFIQELVHLVASDAEFASRNGVFELGLTPTLAGLLVARIDQLPREARAVAQAAAVCGRVFSASTASRAAGCSDSREPYNCLLRADIITEVSRPPDPRFSFRHVLLQEAALSTLTPQNLRGLHARIARVIELDHVDDIVDHLEVIAEHYELGGVSDRAIEYYIRAGERSGYSWNGPRTQALLRKAISLADVERNESSLAKAIGLLLSDLISRCEFDEAMDLCRRYANSGVGIEVRRKSLLQLASCFLASGRVGDCQDVLDELSALPLDDLTVASISFIQIRLGACTANYVAVREALIRLDELSPALPLDMQVQVAASWLQYHAELGDWDKAERMARRRMFLADQHPDVGVRATAHADFGSLLACVGKLHEAAIHLQNAYAMGASLELAPLVLAAASNLAYVSGFLGEFGAGARVLREALDGECWPDWRAAALVNLGALLFELGKASTSEGRLREAVAMSKKLDVEPQIAIEGAIRLAMLGLCQGRVGESESSLKSALEEAELIDGRHELRVLAHCWLAECCLRTGRPGEAVSHAEDAIGYESSSERPPIVAAYRLLGTAKECLNRGEGREALERALASAREMDMRPEEARALIAMARLGLSDDAEEDLRRARALLVACEANRDLRELDAGYRFAVPATG